MEVDISDIDKRSCGDEFGRGAGEVTTYLGHSLPDATRRQRAPGDGEPERQPSVKVAELAQAVEQVLAGRWPKGRPIGLHNDRPAALAVDSLTVLPGFPTEILVSVPE